MNVRPFFTLLFFACIAFGSSCANEPNTTEHIATTAIAADPVSITRESITKPIRTPTLLPTQTAPPTSTTTPQPTMTNTPWPSSTPSYTPPPTLPPLEAQMTVDELFRTNNGCQLPCWWGLIPGETLWEDAWSLLAPLAVEIHLTSGGYRSGVFTAEVKIPVSEDVFPIPLNQIYEVKDGVIQEIRVDIVEGIVEGAQQYTLSELLNTYGQPSEVWMQTRSERRENYLHFNIVMVFAEHRFAIVYGLTAEINNERVYGCLPLFEGVLLFIRPPDEIVTFTNLYDKLSYFADGLPYLPLQEATNMGVEDFYEAFVIADSSACIETPTNLWPPENSQ